MRVIYVVKKFVMKSRCHALATTEKTEAYPSALQSWDESVFHVSVQKNVLRRLIGLDDQLRQAPEWSQ